MAEASVSERVQMAYDKCAMLNEKSNGDGTFTIGGREMMALIELRNLAPEIVTALRGR